MSSLLHRNPYRRARKQPILAGFDPVLTGAVGILLIIGTALVYAATREESLRKMHVALCELLIVGIDTNIDEQLAIISDARFISGTYNLGFFTQ